MSVALPRRRKVPVVSFGVRPNSDNPWSRTVATLATTARQSSRPALHLEQSDLDRLSSTIDDPLCTGQISVHSNSGENTQAFGFCEAALSLVEGEEDVGLQSQGGRHLEDVEGTRP